MADVVVEVEVGVIDPDRGAVDRYVVEALAVSGDVLKLALNV